jgi:hypothetical protein
MSYGILLLRHLDVKFLHSLIHTYPRDSIAQVADCGIPGHSVTTDTDEGVFAHSFVRSNGWIGRFNCASSFVPARQMDKSESIPSLLKTIFDQVGFSSTAFLESKFRLAEQEKCVPFIIERQSDPK